MTCKAIRQSDEMFCAQCGLRWDVNDMFPPQCRKDSINRFRIIGLSGAAGSGKSTVAYYLSKKHGYRRLRFADALKNALRAILGYTGVTDAQIERMIEGDFKELPTELLCGKTPRHAMQTLGTEWGRKCIGEDFWVNLIRIYLNNLGLEERVVIEDVRFENEAEVIRTYGGRVIGLIGRGGIAGSHPSEHGVVPDMTCYNGGSLTETEQWIDYVLTMN